MKKTYYIVAGIAAVALIAGYILIAKPFAPKESPIVENNSLSTEEGLPADSEEKEGAASKQNAEDSSSLPLESNKIVTDDFRITPPPEWEGRPAPEGALALAIYPKEVISDEKAAAIGFRSYFAVIKDSLGGKTREEYVKFIGEELNKIGDPVTLETTWQTKVDGMEASVLDISIRQQGVDFKTLMFLIWDGGNVWSVSLNTTADKWKSYEDTFFTVGNSFERIR
ncbi:MAG: hypothetical protein PHP35_02200 [Candidatus Colwellbacteria bacterium]|nr:hypothetical protein [Candidatus Colwellbacteria bacterium]